MEARIQDLVEETDYPKGGIQNVGHQTQYHYFFGHKIWDPSQKLVL